LRRAAAIAPRFLPEGASSDAFRRNVHDFKQCTDFTITGVACPAQHRMNSDLFNAVAAENR